MASLSLKERSLLIFSIILAVGLLVTLNQYCKLQDELDEFKELAMMNLDSEYYFSFRTNALILEKLESGNMDDTRYLLYSNALASEDMLDKNNAELQADVKALKSRFLAFLGTLCEADRYDACAHLGQLKVTAKEYDAAETALEKAANQGVEEAISELIYLYNNSEWAGASAEKAEYWKAKLK